MNQDQVLSAVRWAITSLGMYGLGRGWLTADQVPLLVAAATAIVPLIWSIAAHTDRAKVASAQAMPQVQVAVTDRSLASPGVTVGSPLSKTIIVPTPSPKPSA